MDIKARESRLPARGEVAAAAARAAVTEDDLRELWTEPGQSFNNFSVIKASG